MGIVNADGSGFHLITSGNSNNAFASFAPDGKHIVYRTTGPDADGLRIMNLDDHPITVLTNVWGNFPVWSPRGDLIAFIRRNGADFNVSTFHRTARAGAVNRPARSQRPPGVVSRWRAAFVLQQSHGIQGRGRVDLARRSPTAASSCAMTAAMSSSLPIISGKKADPPGSRTSQYQTPEPPHRIALAVPLKHSPRWAAANDCPRYDGAPVRWVLLRGRNSHLSWAIR